MVLNTVLGTAVALSFEQRMTTRSAQPTLGDGVSSAGVICGAVTKAGWSALGGSVERPGRVDESHPLGGALFLLPLFAAGAAPSPGSGISAHLIRSVGWPPPPDRCQLGRSWTFLKCLSAPSPVRVPRPDMSDNMALGGPLPETGRAKWTSGTLDNTNSRRLRQLAAVL